MQNKLLIISSILLSFLFHQCTQEKKVKTTDYKSLDTIIPFAGSWINEKYLESIKEFKSPKKAQSNIQECFIRIPERTLEKTIMIYNFHEAGPAVTLVKNEDEYELWEMDNDSLSKFVARITANSPDKIKIGEDKFVKINIKERDGENLILEEILFNRQFLSDKNQKVIFKNDGTIEGLDSLKFYKPMIDYIDAGLQVNQVKLGKSMDSLFAYGFNFTSDHFEIFRLNCLNYDSAYKSCQDVEFGERIYNLKQL
jgi:hypothetical protein